MSELIYTIILILQNGKFHVAECSDPETYIKKRNTHKGFWSWNRGKVEIVKVYYGRHKNAIHNIGIRNFLEILRSEAKLEEFCLEFIV